MIVEWRRVLNDESDRELSSRGIEFQIFNSKFQKEFPILNWTKEIDRLISNRFYNKVQIVIIICMMKNN